jgi:hypothetical protein
MKDLSAVLGALAPALFTDNDGKERQVAPLVKGVQAQFEQWLKAQAKAELLADVQGAGEDVAAAALVKFSERARAGAYGFFSPFCARMLARLDGAAVARLFLLTLRHYDPLVGEEEAARLLEECPAALDAFNDVMERGKNAITPPARKG